jgi:hypothetical protein
MITFNLKSAVGPVSLGRLDHPNSSSTTAQTMPFGGFGGLAGSLLVGVVPASQLDDMRQSKSVYPSLCTYQRATTGAQLPARNT